MLKGAVPFWVNRDPPHWLGSRTWVYSLGIAGCEPVAIGYQNILGYHHGKALLAQVVVVRGQVVVGHTISVCFVVA